MDDIDRMIEEFWTDYPDFVAALAEERRTRKPEKIIGDLAHDVRFLEVANYELARAHCAADREATRWKREAEHAQFWSKVLGFAALALFVACLGLMRSIGW